MAVDMNAVEAWSRANAEALTYGVYLGLLLAMGLLELRLHRSREHPQRKRRWSTNAVLTALWVGSGVLVPLSLLGAAEMADARGWGVLHWFQVAPLYAFGLGLLARSFVSYATHFAMHKVPLLWRIHRVHHLDTQLDISTTARFHPFEALGTAPFSIAGVFLFGIPPVAVLLYEVFDAAIVVFTHANIRLPRWVDRTLGLVFVTPDLHRVHHSTDRRETDSNYGATLSIWDRLFGTLRRLDDARLTDLALGLGEVRDARAQRIVWILASPFLSLKNASKGAD